VVIPAVDFVVASSTGPQLIPPGASANFTITVTSVNGAFTNPVTLSATNLPIGATYTFSPATVTPGTAGANSQLTIVVPRQTAAAPRRNPSPITLALLLLPLAFARRLRMKSARLLVFAFLLTSLSVLTGCGVGGYFSQIQQTYVITVTGTSGSLVRSTTVTLTVQ
jgi:hypothetical protein